MATKHFINTRLIIALTLALTATSCFSQYDSYSERPRQKESFGDRLFFGGDFGAAFGTITIIAIAPLVGYRVNQDFSIGIGGTYQYYKDKTYVPYLSTSVYGGRIFAEHLLPSVKNVFVHVEYEVLNYDKLFEDPYTYDVYKMNVTANNILVGGGYRQPIGGSMSFNLLLLYNLTEDANSLYSNPIIRMGLNFGL